MPRGTRNRKDKHEIFAQWAIDQGVLIHGIEVTPLPGKGVGVVATQPLKEGDVVVQLPASALITVDSDIAKDKRIPKDVTVHGVLAIALTLNHDSSNQKYMAWEATWPTMDNLNTSMPLLWDRKIQDLLPPHAQEILLKQQKKFDIDWDCLKDVVTKEKRQLFTYYWLLVNSRCYYWPLARSRKAKWRRKSLPIDECMALCPFADYLNHSNSGCKFEFNASGCSLTCDREYATGEEVIVSYGSHNNDYLLAEYGFVLSSNSHDNLKLDHLILPKLSESQKSLLEELEYLGDYTLYEAEACHRTEVALRALFLSERKVRQYAGAITDGQKDQIRIDEERTKLLNEYLREVEEKLAHIQVLDSTPQIEMTRLRWEQIRQFLKSTKLS